MFKTIEETKMYLPPEIYELIKHLNEVEEFTMKTLDNNKDYWYIVKIGNSVGIAYKGIDVKKLNWFERVKSILGGLKWKILVITKENF